MFREGDLLFSAARKDKKPCVWYADNGERIGNYEGHEGAVVDIDVDCKKLHFMDIWISFTVDIVSP